MTELKNYKNRARINLKARFLISILLMLQFNIITIFPSVFEPYLSQSILGRAREKKIVDFNLIDLREFTSDKHKSVDDVPFGGGAGMVMKVEPIYKAVLQIKNQKLKIKKNIKKTEKTRIILLSAKGRKFIQEKARELSQLENIILICGRYEGVDERVAEYIADEEISIGDYILTGGELPAMVVADAVARLIPGVISEESLKEESFSGLSKTKSLRTCLGQEKSKDANVLEYPQYTRPAIFKTNEGDEWKVPEVLLSGNHKEINKWKEERAKLLF